MIVSCYLPWFVIVFTWFPFFHQFFYVSSIALLLLSFSHILSLLPVLLLSLPTTKTNCRREHDNTARRDDNNNTQCVCVLEFKTSRVFLHKRSRVGHTRTLCRHGTRRPPHHHPTITHTDNAHQPTHIPHTQPRAPPPHRPTLKIAVGCWCKTVSEQILSFLRRSQDRGRLRVSTSPGVLFVAQASAGDALHMMGSLVSLSFFSPLFSFTSLFFLNLYEHTGHTANTDTVDDVSNDVGDRVTSIMLLTIRCRLNCSGEIHAEPRQALLESTIEKLVCAIAKRQGCLPWLVHAARH